MNHAQLNNHNMYGAFISLRSYTKRLARPFKKGGFEGTWHRQNS